MPRRVVLLLQDLEFGGTQRQALELARRLDPARFRVEVWLLKAGDDLWPLARQYGLTVRYLTRQARVGPLALHRLGQALRQNRPEVLMLLTVVPNLWGRPLARLAGVPRIIGNCRGGGAPRRQRERWLWPLAHHIVCNSAAIRDVLVQGCGVPAPWVSVIPNGVDTEYFQPAPAPPPCPPVALYVGRLAPDKAPETLVRAFALMAPDHPEAQLWLVGDGPLRDPLARLIGQLGLTARVKLMPGQADVRPLYHRASLLALSSRTESLPNVILEAMAAGLPVAATRVGGVPELAAHGVTGLLTPPGDAPALAAALSLLLGDAALRARVGQAGRRRAVQEFSLDHMAGRFAELLAESC
jgi:glycosyltransferase involved in cell wall biosynthesis